MRVAHSLPGWLCSLLLDRELRGGKRRESFVRNGLSAQDREAVRSRSEPRLRTLDGRELFLEILGKPFVELFLVQVASQVARIDVVRWFGIVVVGKVRKGMLDPRALRRKQITRPIGLHGASLRLGPRPSVTLVSALS